MLNGAQILMQTISADNEEVIKEVSEEIQTIQVVKLYCVYSMHVKEWKA